MHARKTPSSIDQLLPCFYCKAGNMTLFSFTYVNHTSYNYTTICLCE